METPGPGIDWCRSKGSILAKQPCLQIILYTIMDVEGQGPGFIPSKLRDTPFKHPFACGVRADICFTAFFRSEPRAEWVFERSKRPCPSRARSAVRGPRGAPHAPLTASCAALRARLRRSDNLPCLGAWP